MMVYGLALRLKIDVDTIMNWPYGKIYDWLAFIAITQETDE